MQRCRNCGTANDEGGAFCEGCGQPLTDSGAPSGSSQTDTVPRTLVARTSESGRPTSVPSGTAPIRPKVSTIPGTNIALSEGETLWRTYPILHFRPFRRSAHGTLFVTDSRIVLRADSRKLTGRTSLLEEVNLESVTGFGSYIDRGLGILGTLVLIIATIVGFLQLVNGNKPSGIIILFLVALVVIASYYYGRLGLQIYCSQATPGPVAFGRFGTSRFQGLLGPLSIIGGIIGGVQASDVLYCFPETNADDIVAELGALVFDLNRKGTLAGTQWES